MKQPAGIVIARRVIVLTLVSALFSACTGGDTTERGPQATPSPVQTVATPRETATPATSSVPPGERPVGLFVVNADGSALHSVWEEDVVAHSWSPDGRFIAFADRVASSHDVILLDLESGATRNLGPSYYSAIEWSPEGGSLLVGVSDEGSPPAAGRFLEIVDVATGTRERLTAGIYGEWSPDGRRISFSGPTCDRRDDRRLLDLDTGQVTDLAPAYPEARVFVSPDWSHIAYFKEPVSAPESAGETATLYVADLDGSNERALPTGSLGSGWPLWSPDGKWLSYTARPPGGGPQTQRPYLLRSDGSGSPMALADQGSVHGWSPDCSTLAVGDDAGIFLYTIHDESQVRVRDGTVRHLDWSPDGSRIAFTAPAPGQDRADLYIYDLATRSTTTVTDAPIHAASPKWSPDGQRIAFLAIPGGYGYGLCL